MQPKICMYIFVIQMKTKKQRRETAAKIKAILVKDFLEAYQPNLDDDSHDFLMVVTGDDLGENTLSNTYFIGNELSYINHLYDLIERNEEARKIILGVSELLIERHPEYISQQIEMAEKLKQINL